MSILAVKAAIRTTGVVFCALVLPIAWVGTVSAADKPVAVAPASRQASLKTFTVTDYGATGDGKQMNTDAIRKAIEACAAAGGGTVLFPSGTYLTGPIELKSRTNLHLDQGATILYSRNFDDFPLVRSEYEGRSTVQARSPIWGNALSDVSITGAGIIDGSGDAWRPLKKSKVSAEYWEHMVKSGGVVDDAGKTWWPSSQAMQGQNELRKLREADSATGDARVEDYAKFRELLRPPMVMLNGCRNVLLEGATFRNSPNWNINLNLCENVTIRNVTAFNPSYAQNGDGMDLGSCRNVLIEGANVDAGDDGICLKSGRDEEGRRRGKPTENVLIRNCTVLHGHGGVVIGSEMSGGVRNVTVTNCTFNGTDNGLRFKTTRGRGGVVENIDISNISMSNITGAAITFDMYYGAKETHSEPVSERTPSFRQFNIRNITCDSAKQAMTIRGLPEMPIDGITFEQVRINATQGASIIDARNVVLRDVRIRSQTAPALQTQNVTNLTSDRVDLVVFEGGAVAATTQPVKSSDAE